MNWLIFQEQSDVILGYRNGDKAGLAGFPEYIGYSDTGHRVYLISYIEGQRHIGEVFSVN
jgi:hypothetical protein